MPESEPHPEPQTAPRRFEVSRGILRMERVMHGVIVFGGVSVIVAVFGIFAFILREIAPLFQSARITPLAVLSAEALPDWARAESAVNSPAEAEHSGRRVRVLLEPGGALTTEVWRQKRTLMGDGEWLLEREENLTPRLQPAAPALEARVLAEGLAVRLADGRVAYLHLGAQGWEARQVFRPFDDTELAGIEPLAGGVSLICHDAAGRARIFSLHIPESGAQRLFGRTKELHPLSGRATFCLPLPLNKSFLLGNAREVALCQATTGTVRLRFQPGHEVARAVLGGKGRELALFDPEGRAHLYAVDDPHPEGGWRAWFGRVWYEGYPKPVHEWQSSSGTDDFEPKLSLVPLIIGTLKGTFYALLVAVPVALLAAMFTAQFLNARLKGVVKPAMEIMASLPSVVLGFLAALWLAPLIEGRVPSVLLALLALPLAALLTGWLWGRLPPRLRAALPHGAEPFWLLPPMLLLAWAGWEMGPVLERHWMVAVLPDGSKAADFRLWWPQFTGLPFDQRNGMVVGFMMGFAVIPVIFTIAEDALSNVPGELVAASEALGASRWQVLRTVVLPVASAGIFSALMIGLGRAVGETMIVVMATGNTPVMDETGRLLFGDWLLGGGKFPLAAHWNPFDGMRTLSANLAVELPEAPQGSTHYRTLFLGAFVLFVLTFALNTAAELLRQRLRRKFKVGA